jgi:hypothetical protein
MANHDAAAVLKGFMSAGWEEVTVGKNAIVLISEPPTEENALRPVSRNLGPLKLIVLGVIFVLATILATPIIAGRLSRLAERLVFATERR